MTSTADIIHSIAWVSEYVQLQYSMYVLLHIVQSLSGLSYLCVFGGDTRPAIPNNDTSVYCDIENEVRNK